MKYRLATPEDAALLAPLNQQLIRNEGHRNPMNLAQLTERRAPCCSVSAFSLA